MNYQIRNIITCHQCDFHGIANGGVMPCTINGRDIIAAAKANECPKGFFAPTRDGESNVTTPATPDPAIWGPPLWAQIHAAQPPAENRDQWLSALFAAVPCGECRQHVAEYLKSSPPDFDNWYQWSVDFHNAVNVRLGKPTWNPDLIASTRD